MHFAKLAKSESDMNYLQIKKWRNQIEISQTKAAELLGVNFETYINWESGKVPISKAVELACYNLSPPQQPYNQLFKNIDEYKHAYKIYFGNDAVGKHLIPTPWKTIKYKLIDFTPDSQESVEVHQMQEQDFSTQEILEGLDYINQTLIHQGLQPMTLAQYKETLKYPISDEILPRYPIKK